MRTEEQKVIDDLVAAKVMLDGPEAEQYRFSLDRLRGELNVFIEGSNEREEILLARHAQERDEFSARELKAHDDLKCRHDVLSEKLQFLAENYAAAFDAVRQHYASTYADDDRSASIRSAIVGDVENVETVLSEETGDIVTRIRRGLQGMTEAEECFWSGAKTDLEGPPEAFDDASGGLGAESIAEALERGAEAIGEDLKPLGLDFSLYGEQKN